MGAEAPDKETKMKHILSAVATALALTIAPTQLLAQAPAKSARLAHGLTEGSPYDIGAKNFAELSEKYSNGTVKVRIYPNAQLGAEQATAKDAQLGLLDMTLVAINNASTWYPPLDVTILPFIFHQSNGLPFRIICNCYHIAINFLNLD